MLSQTYKLYERMRFIKKNTQRRAKQNAEREREKKKIFIKVQDTHNNTYNGWMYGKHRYNHIQPAYRMNTSTSSD